MASPIDKKFFDYHHKIEFYLSENDISDLTKFNCYVDSALRLQIPKWDYVISKPTEESLDQLALTNSNFKVQKNANKIVYKKELLLRVTFSDRIFSNDTVIYDKYKDEPYEWIISGNKKFVFELNGILYLKSGVTLPKDKILFLHCVLFPKKDIKNLHVALVSK